METFLIIFKTKVVIGLELRDFIGRHTMFTVTYVISNNLLPMRTYLEVPTINGEII